MANSRPSTASRCKASRSLPSLFANDHTPPSDPTEPDVDRPHVVDRQPLVGRRRPTTPSCPGYQVFRDGTQVGFSTTTIVHRQQPDPVDRPTAYTVRAVDANDNVSAPTSPVHGARRRCRSSSPGSNWRYLDNGTDQGTAWRASAFDDSAWASGNAQFGYGDGDEVTTVGFGPNANTASTSPPTSAGPSTSPTRRRSRRSACACCVTTVRSSTSTAPRSLVRTCRPARSRRTRWRPANDRRRERDDVLPVQRPARARSSPATNTHRRRGAPELACELRPQLRPRARRRGEHAAAATRRSRSAPVGADARHGDARTRLRCRGGHPPTTSASTTTRCCATARRSARPARPSFTDSTVTDGHPYTYTVVAVDAANNTSDPSNA